MTTSPATLARPDTIKDRLLAAGVSEERALWHLRRRSVRVDGRIVTDPAEPAAVPAHVELRYALEPYLDDGA